jgi:hypothetical protein
MEVMGMEEPGVLEWWSDGVLEDSDIGFSFCELWIDAPILNISNIRR